MLQPRRILPLLLTVAAWAHAPITPALRGPLRTEGARIFDSAGNTAQLRGAVLPDVDAATAATLGVMRIRWNFNAVRIPLKVSEWQRDGQTYLDRVAAAVTRANDADLTVILAAEETTATGLPESSTRAFWTACAGHFRNSPNVVFSAFRPANTVKTDWPQWLRVTQDLYDVIRAAGALQLVAVQAAAFEGFTTEFQIRGENVLYEAHPAVAQSAVRIFGALPGRLPVYAGEWGLSDCAALPADPRSVSDLVFNTLYDFDDRGVSWTASSFTPASLFLDSSDYEPSALTANWRCGQPGMGQTVLTWVTGDPVGFGYLRAEAIASAAGGPASPASPGQLLSIYVEQMGPAPDRLARLDDSGKLPLELGGTQVFFDGRPAPILFAGQYQLNVQAPPSLAPGTETVLQVVYRGVPSNRIPLQVVAAAPELFHDIFTKNAAALNEDGAQNTAANPAAAGSIVVLFATGTGTTTPAGIAGQPAPPAHPLFAQPASVFIDGQIAEVLFAGEVPGFVGLSQINVRLPRQLKPGAMALSLRVGTRLNQAPVLINIR